MKTQSTETETPAAQRTEGSQRRVVRHAEGQQEYSLCGMAFDAFSTGDSDEEIIFAKPGETVTCPECKSHMDFVRQCYNRYRYQPKVPNSEVSNAPGAGHSKT